MIDLSYHEVKAMVLASDGRRAERHAKPSPWTFITAPRYWLTTHRNDSGKRTYIITAGRISSGDALKYPIGFLIHGRYETFFADSRQFTLMVQITLMAWTPQ